MSGKEPSGPGHLTRRLPRTARRLAAQASTSHLSRDSEDLEDLVRATGEDPFQCVVEGIPEEDSLIGGGLAVIY
jgi:hypothetical protein